MTWNLRFDNPADGKNAWPARKPLVASVIGRENPVVFGAQEVIPSMIEDLRGMLPEYRWFGEPRRPNDEGCPLFYRRDILEVVEQHTFWLSETPDVVGSRSWESSLPRICTWGIFRPIDAPALRLGIFNTHLDHVSDLARIRGVEAVVRVMRAYAVAAADMGWIFMGDFNVGDSSPVGEVVRSAHWTSLDGQACRLENIFRTAGVDVPGPTFHGFTGFSTDPEPIDHIYLSDNLSMESPKIDRQQYQGRYPSDHFPVTVRLTSIQRDS